ncbi:MAG: hypothetical protein WC854_04630 [Bacteroidales bacterium]
MYPKVYNSLPGLVYSEGKAPCNPLLLLIAYNGTDPEALERRLKVHEEHLGKIARLKKE